MLLLPKPERQPKAAPKRIVRRAWPRRYRPTRRGLSEAMAAGADRRKELMAEADKLCGEIVRARGRCEIETCRTTRNIQWAHGLSRSYHNVRWDHAENGFCLCSGCHKFFTHHPIEWELWMRRRLTSARYEALRVRAQTHTKLDLALIVVALKADHARLVKA